MRTPTNFRLKKEEDYPCYMNVRSLYAYELATIGGLFLLRGEESCPDLEWNSKRGGSTNVGFKIFRIFLIECTSTFSPSKASRSFI